jgi:RNA polymerase sigma factor (sigma-70 family)
MPIANSTLLVDEQQLDELIRQSCYDIASFARTSGLDREDLTQEVAIKLIRRWDQVMAAEYPQAYARRVARNQLIDLYRKVARRRGIAPSVSMQALEEAGVQF